MMIFKTGYRSIPTVTAHVTSLIAHTQKKIRFLFQDILLKVSKHVIKKKKKQNPLWNSPGIPERLFGSSFLHPIKIFPLKNFN